MSEPLLVIDRVRKSYASGTLPALLGVSFEVAAGEVTAIMGATGCGKGTLLTLIGHPTERDISVAGKRLDEIASPYAYRAETVGFEFQNHHLLPAGMGDRRTRRCLPGRSSPHRRSSSIRASPNGCGQVHKQDYPLLVREFPENRDACRPEIGD